MMPAALHAAEYYVATNGNDNNPGTISQPWATWQKGFSSITYGDLLYIRGGTYSPSGTFVGSVLCGAGASGKNGTASRLYSVKAYPGEVPVLNCINLAGSAVNKAGLILYNCSYWELKGLFVTNVKQVSVNYESQGIRVEDGHHNTISCTAYNNEGPGFRIRTPGGNENHFLNCDSYSNYDPLKNGDEADGFDLGFGSGNYIIRATGCRSWNNGDDGYDMYQQGGFSCYYHLESCWAWHNGYKPGSEIRAGDGNGFKLGLDGQIYDGKTKRYLRNCIAFNNRQRGYSQESARVKKEIYNCISYQNHSWGFSFGWTEDPSGFEVGDILRNNIAFGDGVENLHGGTFYATRSSEKNSWDKSTGVTVSAADFASTDGSELERQRTGDGNLPEMNFLHLVPRSDLIDKGADVGLSFSGKAPDLGAFELLTAAAAITGTILTSARMGY